MSINPADEIVFRLLGRPLPIRRDDVVAELVAIREKQDRAAIGLGIKPAPSLARLRDEAEIGREFKELFADLELPRPAPRGDGNATGLRLDHLRKLQRFCPQWRDAQLGAIAVVDTKGFEVIANDIVAAAKRLAANPIMGSVHRPHALRPVVRVDEAGRRTTRWCGDPHWWMSRFHDPLLRCLTAVGDGYGGWYP